MFQWHFMGHQEVRGVPGSLRCASGVLGAFQGIQRGFRGVSGGFGDFTGDAHAISGVSEGIGCVTRGPSDFQGKEFKEVSEIF